MGTYDRSMGSYDRSTGTYGCFMGARKSALHGVVPMGIASLPL